MVRDITQILEMSVAVLLSLFANAYTVNANPNDRRQQHVLPGIGPRADTSRLKLDIKHS